MKNSKKLEKSKGVVLVAFNTEELNYVSIADNCARLVSQQLNLPVTLITDNNSSPVFEYDKVIRTEYTGNNSRYDFVIKKQVRWNNFNRYKVYEYSPYDCTLLIDSDYLILDDSLLKLFDVVDDYLIIKNNLDIPLGTTNQMGNCSLPFLWATVVVFNKTQKTKLLFDFVGRVQRNWGYYRSLFNIDGAQYRNDFAFTIADILVNGNHLENKTHIPFSMLTISKQLKQLELHENLLLIREENKVIVSPLQNLHIMDKHYLQSENFKKFVTCLITKNNKVS